MSTPADGAPGEGSGVPAGAAGADGTTILALRRELTWRDLVVYGLLFIGVTAPMGTFGVLDARSGGAIALVFVVATVAMSFTAWSYARMSEAVPQAGSVYAYASAGLGRRAGFLAGWMVTLDYLFIPALASLFVGIACHALVPAVPVWVFTLVAVALTTGLNLRDVRLAARVGLVMLAVELVVLGAFAVLAVVYLAQHGPTRGWLTPLTGVGGLGPAGVVGAASVAVLAFLGFDAIATFAEETTGSSRQVGRALQFCLVLAGLLFVTQTYLGALLSTATPAALAADPEAQGTAFFAMLDASIGPWFSTVVTVVRAVGPVFSALVAQAAVSRLLYAMARERALPAPLARLGTTGRTPRNAILLSAVVTLVVATLAATRPDGLDVLSSMVTVGALTAFVFLHASVVGFFRRRLGRTVWHVVVPVVGSLVIVAVLVEASRLALVIAAGWFVLGLAAMVLRPSAARALGGGAGDVTAATGDGGPVR
ncbi:APC family permease [Georgenia sp. SYP-B2076]|uniref:APC family permease n=1 Tax=Georgenia sp. SYP-B2076 TaxID=2495881 RepID=UPI001F0C1C9B|nr:APC family permease [Georgenia sp. SYP-B2076]